MPRASGVAIKNACLLTLHWCYKVYSRIFGDSVANTNILGFDLSYGRVWKLPDGSVWSFAGRETKQNEPKKINLLEMSISLPPSKITNTKQYTLPAAVQSGIDRVVKDLENRGIITRTYSPYNSPVWPVKKPDGQWRLTIDYRQLNANTAPLTAAGRSTGELVTQIQGASHTWMVTLDVFYGSTPGT